MSSDRRQTVWITRHGNRRDFVDPDWQRTAPNPYDPPLSEDGVVQAKELGRRLAGEGITRIYSSPFLRAVETACHVADELDLVVEIEQGACEWFNPAWFPAHPEFIALKELAARFPRIKREDTSFVYPDFPETWDDLMARSHRTVGEIIQQTSEDILIVGHGASLIGFARALTGGEAEINADFCALVKVVHHVGRWRMELNGDTSHLSDPSSAIRFT